MTFNRYFTPTECEEIFKKRDDMDWEQHDAFWAIVTPKTNLQAVGLSDSVEAMLTTKAMLKEHPKHFADMTIVPAYIKDDHDGKKLHPIYPNR